MPENSSCSSAGSCTKSSCEGCPSHNGGPQSFLVEQNKFSNIKHVIGVVSGKGGVGKSFVTSSLAVNMAKKGYKVGILDAEDRKSTRLNSSHSRKSRMPSSA